VKGGENTDYEVLLLKSHCGKKDSMTQISNWSKTQRYEGGKPSPRYRNKEVRQALPARGQKLFYTKGGTGKHVMWVQDVSRGENQRILLRGNCDYQRGGVVVPKGTVHPNPSKGRKGKNTSNRAHRRKFEGTGGKKKRKRAAANA